MRPPPFDRELADGLRRLGDQVPPPLRIEHIAQRRERGRRERLTDEELRRGGAFTVEERDVPGSHARLLICRPTGPRPAVAALYWVHGGGMVLGHNREGADEFLDWAERLRLVVVSVEYRLAPETPHPGPVEDCWAGLRWLADNGAQVGVPPERIVVAGVSAGGGIAAALKVEQPGPFP
jgi:acetyl esterase/lipase